MNTTIITGNIAADAVVRHNEGKDSAISFSVAVNKKWRNQAGEVQQQTTWFDCTIWRKPENTTVANYLKKGVMATIRGEVSARAWADKTTGEPQTRLNLKVEDIVFNSSGQQAAPAPQVSAQAQQFTAPAQATYASTPATAAWPATQPQQSSNNDLPF